jgi:hypothetical protein
MRHPRGARAAISRRATLKLGAGGLLAASLGAPRAPDAASAAAVEEFTTLTRDQAMSVTAIAERIWPGAERAGAPTYIDRALAGAYAPQIAGYHTVLAQLDAVAQSRFGSVFAKASGEEQDALLGELEANRLEDLPAPRGKDLFDMLRDHVMEGVLCDPVHGGNRDFAGWKDVGYPGPYRLYTSDEQTSTQPLNLPYQGIEDL